MIISQLHYSIIANYIDWCKELDFWVELTELPEEKKALAIFSSLRGKAKKVALQLEIKDLKVRGGVKQGIQQR